MPNYPCDIHDGEHQGIFMVSNTLDGNTLACCPLGLMTFGVLLYKAADQALFDTEMASLGYFPTPPEPVATKAPAKKAAPRKANTAKAKTVGAKSKAAVPTNGQSGESASGQVDTGQHGGPVDPGPLGDDGLPLNPDF